MNQEVFKDKWSQMKGNIQNQWSLLTDEDIRKIAGKYEILVDKLQERYGYSANEAARKLRTFAENASRSHQLKANIGRLGENINNQVRRSPWMLAAISSISGLLIGLMLRDKTLKSKKLRLRIRR